uniref:serine hydrolase domain-containing protein n=1 Tax=Sinomonas sp. G460-2 TaxID=3393464 RepID=UPI0039EFCAAC
APSSSAGRSGAGQSGAGESGASQSGAGEPWQALPAGAQDVVSQFVSDQGAAGIAVAVSSGQKQYLATMGDASEGVAWSADTRSAFRSITKSFVGTVVLQLVAEGKLSLDDPISRYAPDVASLRYNGADAGSAITVRMALEMRTGLTEFSGTQDFSDQLDTDYMGSFTDDQLLGYAFAQPLDFAPGSAYEYTNTNFVLLGKVIEAVTGNSWDHEVQRRILTPLGLGSVGYSGENDPSSSDPSRTVATPYEIDSNSNLESLAQVSPSLYGASGGLFGDIGDLLRWGHALGSGALLPVSVQQQRLTAISQPSTDPGSPDYDAYGLAAGEIDGWWGHTGTGLGYESLTMYQPSTGMTVAILINTQLPNPNGPAILFKQLEGALAGIAG